MSKVLASEELYGTYIQHIVNLIEQYGQVDGDHHLRWVIDQIARVVWGERYDEWVESMCAGEEGPDTYGYDAGIAP